MAEIVEDREDRHPQTSYASNITASNAIDSVDTYQPFFLFKIQFWLLATILSLFSTVSGTDCQFLGRASLSILPELSYDWQVQPLNPMSFELPKYSIDLPNYAHKDAFETTSTNYSLDLDQNVEELGAESMTDSELDSFDELTSLPKRKTIATLQSNTLAVPVLTHKAIATTTASVSEVVVSSEPTRSLRQTPARTFEVEAFQVLQTEAQKQSKPFFIRFGAKWCLPCRIMEETTLKNPQLAGFIQDNFLYTKLDEKDFDAISLKQIFQFVSLPTILFFDADGELLEQHEGSLTTHQFLTKLEQHFTFSNARLSAEVMA
ncbi:MAG: thioredoxin family protein, partial [Bacteroidota bacterium]